MTSHCKGPTRRLGRPARASTTQKDVALLVDTDSVYEQACGSAIAAVLRRQYHVYGDERYVRLSQISISEAYLLDTLAQAMAQVPFVIHSFHSDNGSQYTNKRVAYMLEKLRIEQTKSRPRHSNDNALAKSKHNSIVRRNMGYEHIPKKLAQPIHDFYQATFNPWINHHRPCLYASEVTDSKGKIRKRYAHKDTQTPLEKLVTLMAQNKAELKPDITLKSLLDKAMAETDMQGRAAHAQRETSVVGQNNSLQKSA